MLLLGFVTWPVWQWLWGQWWGNDYYSHGILIIPVAAYLAWKRLANQPVEDDPAPKGDNWGLLILGGSLVGYLYLLNRSAYYLAAFAMLGMGIGLLWLVWGKGLVKRLAFPLGFLTLMIPLPFLTRVTLPLSLFTGLCSGTLVRFLGLDVTVVGASVQLPNTNLVIGAQCSGINSIIALTSLMLLAAYALNGPLWGRILLVILAIPLAMLGNILRVATLLVVARYWGTQTAFTYYHNYSGILAFLLIVFLIIPISRSLQCKTLRYELL